MTQRKKDRHRKLLQLPGLARPGYTYELTNLIYQTKQVTNAIKSQKKIKNNLGFLDSEIEGGEGRTDL
jgi:hypothetical protein